MDIREPTRLLPQALANMVRVSNNQITNIWEDNGFGHNLWVAQGCAHSGRQWSVPTTTQIK